MFPVRFLAIVGLLAGAEAFSTKTSSVDRSSALRSTADRRAFLTAGTAALSFLASTTQPALATPEPELRQGIEVNPFNGLAFNYKGGDFGGLDASELNEPSVSYSDFNQRLKAKEVDFVEFMAPDGDVAYATFKPKEGEAKQPAIRIGEGYPIEQHDGYSSPMFCIRAVKNAGVPYKFTVPGMAKFLKQ